MKDREANHGDVSAAGAGSQEKVEPETKQRFDRTLAARCRTTFGWLLRGLGQIFRAMLLLWATLAIHFSNLPWPWMRTALAVAFAVLGIWALWLSRKPRMRWAFVGTFLGVVIWFYCIPPSHDRPWRPDVAVMPRAIIDGDRVRITGVRNFAYRTRHDFTERWEEREFSIAHVTSLDLYISFWAPGPVAHTLVSFNFDDGTPPFCVSIEARPEVGEGFAPLPALFKQFELMYVVGDEHDLIGSRASHRSEDVFLYPIIATPEGVRQLLRVYLERINELADRPEWYHLLSNNCTINIFRYANAAGREGRFDVRQLLNGWVDRYLYSVGRVDTSLPFEELRARSRITDLAKAAEGAPDFSQRIRANLPQPSPPPGRN